MPDPHEHGPGHENARHADGSDTAEAGIGDSFHDVKALMR
jgi:hypothetical protein